MKKEEEETEVIELRIPRNATKPDLSLLTPIYTIHMLETAINNIKEFNKLSTSLTQEEIYEKVKEETKEDIRKIEIDMLVEKKYSIRVQESSEQRILKGQEEINSLKIQLDKLREDHLFINKDYIDKEVKKEIAKFELERVKFEAILNEKDKINNNMSYMLETIKKNMERKSTVELSRIGESTLIQMANLAFRDFNGFKLKDTHAIAHSGDCHLVFSDFTVLADAKQYTNKVSITDREKIKADLLCNDHIEFAWLVSMDTGIDAFNKAPFMFEFISDKKIVCYINSLTKNNEPIEVLRCVWFICKLIHDKITDKEDKDESSENDELDFLRNYKEVVKENLLAYQKFSTSRDKTLKALKKTLGEQDNLIKSILNKETNIFCTQVMDWWDTNIIKEEGASLKPLELWHKFKRDNKELPSDIGVNSFKENLSSCIEDEEDMILNAKGAVIEIKNVRLKENEQTEKIVPKEIVKDKFKPIMNNGTTVLKINTEKKKTKPKLIFSSETEELIIKLYVEEKKNIIEISDIIICEIWKVASVLVNNKIIVNRQEALGYDIYKESDEYKAKCVK